jgi:NAD(P)-dependent dehydrogenase (short-subunit alcohol dehydrogenase family)
MNRKRNDFMGKEERVVLISGASSGFGRAAAEELSRRGWRVYGTSRHAARDQGMNRVEGCGLRVEKAANSNERSEQNTDKEYLSVPPDAARIKKCESEVGWEMVELDVRDDGSVRRCVERVMAAAGRIDVLVNNAGYVLNGFAEEATAAEAREQFETNFFGMARLTRAALPGMRERRAGRIIHISSLAGLVGVPYRAFYAASKWAMEGYSETLHYELASMGIDVILIEPGFFRTNLDRASVQCAQVIGDYDFIRPKVDAYFRQSVRRGGNPAAVGRLIAEAAEAKRPKMRYRIGRDSVWLPRVRALLPKRLYSFGVRKRFGLEKD